MFKNAGEKKKQTSVFAGDTFTDSRDNFRSNSIAITTSNRIRESYLLIKKIAKIPEPGEQLRIVTQKELLAFDFILAILKEEKILEMYLAFFQMGKKIAIEIVRLFNQGDILNIFLLLNDGLLKQKPDVYGILEANKSDNFRVITARTHTKIILIRTPGNHYVIEGSGNMSVGARIEQYIFEENRPVYDFHRKWMEDL